MRWRAQAERGGCWRGSVYLSALKPCVAADGQLDESSDLEAGLRTWQPDVVCMGQIKSLDTLDAVRLCWTLWPWINLLTLLTPRHFPR